MEPTADTPEPRVERIEFAGTGAEYFRIWIVNLLLTILTLGIYSAWAKVRREQYFHGSTGIGGHAFGYHARGIQILRGRLIAVLAFVIYVLASERWPLVGGLLFLLFLVAMPWFVTRGRIFQMRVTSWRGVRFDFDEDYGSAFGVLLLAPIASVLSLGLALPWATRLRYRWLIDDTSYGRSYFRTTIGLRPLVMTVLGVAAIGILIALYFVFGSGFLLRMVGAEVGPESRQFAGFVVLAVFYLPLLLGGYLMMAVWRRGVLNAVLPATTVGPLSLDCRISARRLAAIYLTNFLGIVLTFGLFTPWARVRAAKYQLESVGVHVRGSLDEFVASESTAVSALGEELGEIFDVGAEI